MGLNWVIKVPMPAAGPFMTVAIRILDLIDLKKSRVLLQRVDGSIFLSIINGAPNFGYRSCCWRFEIVWPLRNSTMERNTSSKLLLTSIGRNETAFLGWISRNFLLISSPMTSCGTKITLPLCRLSWNVLWIFGKMSDFNSSSCVKDSINDCRKCERPMTRQ